MRATFGVLFGFCLLVSVPALAGNLNSDKGKTVWASTQCVKPVVPPSVLSANPETAGEDMNALITKHNAYVDAVQAYMHCISTEAERDQAMITQGIAAAAQKAISEAQASVDDANAALRSRQK